MAVVSFETLGDLEEFLGASFEDDTQFEDFYTAFEGELQVRDFEESPFGWIGQLYAGRDDSFEDSTDERDAGDVVSSDYGQQSIDDTPSSLDNINQYYDQDLEIAQAMVEDGLDIFAIAEELEFPQEYAQTLANDFSDDEPATAEEIVNGFYNLLEKEVALDEMTGDDLNTGEETSYDKEQEQDSSPETEDGTESNQQDSWDKLFTSLFGSEWSDIKSAKHLNEMSAIAEEFSGLENPGLVDTLTFVSDLGGVASMDDFFMLALEALFL